MSTTTTIEWVPVGETENLPDDDSTVLVGWADDGAVDTGFLDDGVWRALSQSRFKPAPDFWAAFPKVPALSKTRGEGR